MLQLRVGTRMRMVTEHPTNKPVDRSHMHHVCNARGTDTRAASLL